MDGTIELQKLDCNCNNCKYLVRDIDKFDRSLKFHQELALDHFNTIKNKLNQKAKYWLDRGDAKKHDLLKKEADGMVFQFNKKEVAIQYGKCDKFGKDVSFIPNTLQLDTQHCFEHRKG